MHLDGCMNIMLLQSNDHNYSVSTHYNYIYILVLTTLMMVAWVAETCRWFIHSFIHSGVFVSLVFKNCYIWLLHGTWEIFSLQIFRL